MPPVEYPSLPIECPSPPVDYPSPPIEHRLSSTLAAMVALQAAYGCISPNDGRVVSSIAAEKKPAGAAEP